MTLDPQPLGPQLLDAGSFKAELERSLPTATKQIIVASAYLTKMGAEWLSSIVPRKCNTTIVVRWRLSDLLAGSSDLECYEIAKASGWQFRIHQDLHAKIWLVDRVAMLVGSSNATARGLSLVENGNWEFGVCLAPRDSDVAILTRRADEAVIVNDMLFQQIRATVQAGYQRKHVNVAEWPADLALLLRPSAAPSAIWVAECFQTDGSWMARSSGDAPLHDSHRTDLSLLGISGNSSIDRLSLAKALTETAEYRWLTARLNIAPGEAYFGELSAALHDALADDPKPYRQTVKSLLSNLLGWIKVLEVTEIRIDTPRHSQRVTLIPTT